MELTLDGYISFLPMSEVLSAARPLRVAGNMITSAGPDRLFGLAVVLRITGLMFASCKSIRRFLLRFGVAEDNR